MEFKECIKEAREELGINEWIDKSDYRWNKIINLAKEKYWSGDTFRRLKKETIEEANGECKICRNSERLTAHHIYYGKWEETICLCHNCHEIIHGYNIKKYGFILQLTLSYWDELNYVLQEYPNLANMVLKCREEIDLMINKNNIILSWKELMES